MILVFFFSSDELSNRDKLRLPRTDPAAAHATEIARTTCVRRDGFIMIVFGEKKKQVKMLIGKY